MSDFSGTRRKGVRQRIGAASGKRVPVTRREVAAAQLAVATKERFGDPVPTWLRRLAEAKAPSVTPDVAAGGSEERRAKEEVPPTPVASARETRPRGEPLKRAETDPLRGSSVVLAERIRDEQVLSDVLDSLSWIGKHDDPGPYMQRLLQFHRYSELLTLPDLLELRHIAKPTIELKFYHVDLHDLDAITGELRRRDK